MRILSTSAILITGLLVSHALGDTPPSVCAQSGACGGSQAGRHVVTGCIPIRPVAQRSGRCPRKYAADDGTVAYPIRLFAMLRWAQEDPTNRTLARLVS